MPDHNQARYKLRPPDIYLQSILTQGDIYSRQIDKSFLYSKSIPGQSVFILFVLVIFNIFILLIITRPLTGGLQQFLRNGSYMPLLFTGGFTLYYAITSMVLRPQRWYDAATHGELALAKVRYIRPLRDRSGSVYGFSAQLDIAHQGREFRSEHREEGYGDTWPNYVVQGDVLVVIIHSYKPILYLAISPNQQSVQPPTYDPPLVNIDRIIYGPSAGRHRPKS
jgi:hypothetical protein